VISLIGVLRASNLRSGYVEGKELAQPRRLDLHQPFALVVFAKRQNIESDAVALGLGNPLDPSRQVISTLFPQSPLLQVEDKLLPQSSEAAILSISSHEIDLPSTTGEPRTAVLCRYVDSIWW